MVDAFLELQREDPRRAGSVYSRIERRLGLRPGSARSRLALAERRGLITPGRKGSAERDPGPRYAEVKAQGASGS